MCLARMLAVALVVSACALGAGCCCFGGDWVPPTVDDAGAEAEARRYWAQSADALAAQLEADAGPGSDGGCTSGLGALAMDVVVAVVSRGHAGGDSAAQVSIDPGACFSQVLVTVVLTAGVWHAIAVTAETADGRVARLGDDSSYLLYVYVSHDESDSDWSSDELF